MLNMLVDIVDTIYLVCVLCSGLDSRVSTDRFYSAHGHGAAQLTARRRAVAGWRGGEASRRREERRGDIRG